MLKLIEIKDGKLVGNIESVGLNPLAVGEFTEWATACFPQLTVVDSALVQRFWDAVNAYNEHEDNK